MMTRSLLLTPGHAVLVVGWVWGVCRELGCRVVSVLRSGIAEACCMDFIWHALMKAIILYALSCYLVAWQWPQVEDLCCVADGGFGESCLA